MDEFEEDLDVEDEAMDFNDADYTYLEERSMEDVEERPIIEEDNDPSEIDELERKHLAYQREIALMKQQQ